jgi:hypothetical protein
MHRDRFLDVVAAIIESVLLGGNPRDRLIGVSPKYSQRIRPQA